MLIGLFSVCKNCVGYNKNTEIKTQQISNPIPINRAFLNFLGGKIFSRLCSISAIIRLPESKPGSGIRLIMTQVSHQMNFT
jgi:hypothetical protein